MDLIIPEPLRVEHEELYAEVQRMAAAADGRLGEIMQDLLDRFDTHFRDEELFALPPLGSLDQVAMGKAVDAPPIIEMAQRLKAELPKMFAEHQGIVRQVERLCDVAAREDKPEYVEFGRRLQLHARMEEEILYPAAIILGEYLSLKPETESAASTSTAKD